ncbi:HLA class II histocompatibility antigen, DM alpha chain [Pogona vitticeps]
MGPGRCQWGGLLRAWLLLAAAAAAVAEAQGEVAHVFSEVFFCQRDSPFSGLSQSLDNEQLFWFDFPGSSWHPRLTDFRPEAENRTSKDEILKLSNICTLALDVLTNFSQEYMPEAKGIPQVDVFTLQPFQLGQPTTLVCSVTNIFPPSVTISWELQDEPVSQGVFTTHVYPLEGLDFQMFSYLEVTPQEGQVYSCTVKTPGDKSSTTTFWVPKDPVDPQLLGNILCAVAFGVGILLAILGAILVILMLQTKNAE